MKFLKKNIKNLTSSIALSYYIINLYGKNTFDIEQKLTTFLCTF